MVTKYIILSFIILPPYTENSRYNFHIKRWYKSITVDCISSELSALAHRNTRLYYLMNVSILTANSYEHIEQQQNWKLQSPTKNSIPDPLISVGIMP